jgi:arylsulfatase A
VNADIPAGSAEDSYNQLDMIQGNAKSARDTLVHNTNANGYALRHQDWVLVAAKTGAVSKVPDWFDSANGYTSHASPGELYNLREDISQRKNLYTEMPDKVAELTRRLEQLRTKSQVR